MIYPDIQDFIDDINCEFYERGVDHLYHAVFREEDRSHGIVIVSPVCGDILIRRIEYCPLCNGNMNRHEAAMKIVMDII